MKIRKTIALLFFTGSALSTAFTSFAQENTLRLGLIHINPHSSATDLVGPLTPPGANLQVMNKSTLTIGYARRLTENLELELAFGIPPKHDVEGRGALQTAGVIAKVKQTAPTLFLNYKFFDENTALRPFVGLGVNHTRFSSTVTPEGNIASGGPTVHSLSSSTGWAAQAGLSYAVDKQWSIVASIATADVSTDLKSVTNDTVIRRSNISFNPVAVAISAAYRF